MTVLAARPTVHQCTWGSLVLVRGGHAGTLVGADVVVMATTHAVAPTSGRSRPRRAANHGAHASTVTSASPPTRRAWCSPWTTSPHDAPDNTLTRSILVAGP